MRIRYKATGAETVSSTFNMHALSEVLTPDNSAFIKELDVFVKGAWKDMGEAFRDHDIITDNYNSCFFEPQNEEDRKRGYAL